MVTLSSPHLTEPSVFMIDSGSGVNLIKQSVIKFNVPWEDERTYTLQGISSQSVGTLGSVLISLMGKPTLFHVVPDSVGFVQNGILGNRFLQDHAANVDYKNKCLHYDNTKIPFTEIVNIKIKGRTISPFYVNVTNPEKQYGYIPLVTPTKGLYYGNAIVTNVNGRAYLPIINTTEVNYKLEIPSVELEDFEAILSGTETRGHTVADSCPSTAETRGHTAARNESLNLVEALNKDNSVKELDDTHLVENHKSLNLENECDVTPCVRKSKRCGYATGIRGHTVDNPTLEIVEAMRSHNESWNFDDNLADKPPGLKTTCFVSNPSYFMDRNDSPDKMARNAAVIRLLRLDHLNNEERDNVISLVTKHSDRFHFSDEKLDATNATQHFIPTINEAPVHTKQYRFPPIHKTEIDKQVGKLLSDGLIECSTSPYNSPVWIVPKKPDSSGNKRWRMVIDYRNLNEKTIGDAYPLPNISDILDQLGNAKYFSVLDLASGFHQIPMAPKDAPKTAFSTPYGHYQFKRMPFGLKNAPSTFQRLMDNVLSGLQGNELFVYMDDIVIYARSLREHEIKFERLMKRLKEANLKLQPDKCEFLRREVAYLGHIICSEGVRPDPDKIKSVTEFPNPKNPKNIKQFLGLVGYYRRFIPNFSKIAKPLTDLLKKDKAFTWLSKHQEAFNALKLSLCEEPILQYPDFNRPFILTTDASGYAIGGVLSQGEIGKDLPIAYTSRVLNNAEQNYSTIEKECLAIVYCVSHFRPYLYGKKFTIITDHKPLVWLHSIKDPTSRMWKWRTKLAEYDYEIRYKAGSLNKNADALSRNPPSSITLPLQTIDEIDESSDESIFSAPNPKTRITESNAQEREISSFLNKDSVTRSPSLSPRPLTPNIVIEEHNDEDEDTDMEDYNDHNQTFETLGESNRSYEEIFDSDQVPYQKEPLEQPRLNKSTLTEAREFTKSSG